MDFKSHFINTTLSSWQSRKWEKSCATSLWPLHSRLFDIRSGETDDLMTEAFQCVSVRHRAFYLKLFFPLPSLWICLQDHVWMNCSVMPTWGHSSWTELSVVFHVVIIKLVAKTLIIRWVDGAENHLLKTSCIGLCAPNLMTISQHLSRVQCLYWVWMFGCIWYL